MKDFYNWLMESDSFGVSIAFVILFILTLIFAGVLLATLFIIAPWFTLFLLATCPPAYLYTQYKKEKGKNNG